MSTYEQNMYILSLHVISAWKHQAWFCEIAFLRGKRHDAFCGNSLLIWILSAGDMKNGES